MYEAAIKTASTGVYFAVPYMAKLIIEFMEKNYQKENRNLRKSRDLLVERILHRYPARRVDSDDDLFDALEEYDSYRNENVSVYLGRYRRGGCSYRLCALLRERYARLCRGRGSHGRGS